MKYRAVANFIAYFSGVIVNFILQKKFVFESNGKLSSIFLKAMLVSFFGYLLDTAIIYGLSQIPFFDEHQTVTKLISTGIVFLLSAGVAATLLLFFSGSDVPLSSFLLFSVSVFS